MDYNNTASYPEFDNKEHQSMSDALWQLPSNYGDNKIILMVRDPWTMFTYWETRNDVEENLREEINRKGKVVSKSVLRVYEINGEDVKTVMCFELRDWVSDWYIHVTEPGISSFVEIGLLCEDGDFFILAKSNIVCTPANKMSDIIDEKWMCSEDLYYKMFARSGGLSSMGSSAEIVEVVKRRLKEWRLPIGLSSGEMFGSSSLFISRKKND